MSRLLVVSHLPGETRAAWIQDNRLHDLQIQRADLGGRAGDIFLGRIKSLRPEQGGAFVELGLSRDGFLPFDHCEAKPVEGGGDRGRGVAGGDGGKRRKA